MKKCVPYRTDTLLGSYLFEQTCLFVETLPAILILPFFPFFRITITKIFSSFHCISFIFVRLFCKLSSSGSSDPCHFGGTRSVLSWETIVHYPRYKLRGQIRLKDTTLSLGSDLLSNYCLYCRFVSFIFFCFCFLTNTRELQLYCNIIH